MAAESSPPLREPKRELPEEVLNRLIDMRNANWRYGVADQRSDFKGWTSAARDAVEAENALVSAILSYAEARGEEQKKLSATEAWGVLWLLTNAASLRSPVDRLASIRDALRQLGFDPEDVEVAQGASAFPSQGNPETV